MTPDEEKAYYARRQKPKKVEVSSKLHSNKFADVEYKADGPSKDSFTLLSVGRDNTIQMIFHRPIGLTGLEGDDWVASTPAGVAQLEGRTEHPDESAHRKEEYKALLALYYAKNFENGYVNKDGILFDQGGKPRHETITPAKKLSKEAWNLANPVKTQKKGEKKQKGRPEEPYDCYLGYILQTEEETHGGSVGSAPTPSGSAEAAAPKRKGKGNFPSLGLASNISHKSMAVHSTPRSEGKKSPIQVEQEFLEFTREKTNIATAHGKVERAKYQTVYGHGPGKTEQVSLPKLKGLSKEAAQEKIFDLLMGVCSE